MAEHQYKEAFCLMLYQGQKTKRVLDIWNSRNGVTPFCAVIDDEEYLHIAFYFDRRVPGHKLRPGDYFWRDMTELEAERIAASRIDYLEPNLDGRERAARIADVARSILRDGEAPYLDRAPFITVTDGGRDG